MDDILKFYLLAEESGWDCSTYAFQYQQNIENDATYRILMYNVIEAKKHLSSKADLVVKKAESLNLNPKTVKEAFILDSQIHYLALHSFPEFYLNPLSINPNYSGSVSSIGDLIFEVEGEEISLNELIFDERYTLQQKKDAVEKQINSDLADMNSIIERSQKIIMKKAFNRENHKRDQWMNFFEILIISLYNIFFFTLMIGSGNVSAIAESLFSPMKNRVTSYFIYIFPILLLLFDVIYTAYHTYRSRISEPYNYARRVLLKNPDGVFEDVRKEKERLYHYIIGAINAKIKLSDDIKDFSKLSSSYVDFKAVLEVSSLREKRAYKILSGINTTFSTLTGIAGFILLLLLIVGGNLGVII